MIIPIKKRFKYAGHIFDELLKAGWELETAVSFVNNIPDADVEEVVRCKDCEYWQDNNNGYPHEECRWGKDETPDTDDYCSYGKKVE